METQARLRGARAPRGLPALLWVLIALAACCTLSEVRALARGQAGQAPAAAATSGTTYNVVPLSDDPEVAAAYINNKGQVAFTENPFIPNEFSRARFFDGKTVRSIIRFNERQSAASALNEVGQVSGFVDSNRFSGAYRWSKERGFERLLPAGGQGNDINNKGEVAGWTFFDPSHPTQANAAFWNAPNVATSVGPINAGSFALALNDARTVVGVFPLVVAGQFLQMPFRWTLSSGELHTPSTIPSDRSAANDVNTAGYVVGGAVFQEGQREHAFLWTPQEQLIDIGGNGFSIATKINDNGMVIGLKEPFAFAWARESGLVQIGAGIPNVTQSLADDLNNRGQVVGTANLNGSRAYLWTLSGGIVDLNSRVRKLPHELFLRRALAISDYGAIVATTDTGLVLLTTQPVSGLRPLVGPITVTGKRQPGHLLSFSANFTDVDPHDTHKATWDWGDGHKDLGTVNERNGSGNVSGQHTYNAQGDYTVKLTVTDSSGKSTVVRLNVPVVKTCPCMAGEGQFVSPVGASRLPTSQPGVATFAFASDAGSMTVVRFNSAGLRFQSDQVDSKGGRGREVLFGGSGTLNGAGGYKFTLAATTNGAGKLNGVRVRIWHADPVSGAELVDYDNMRASAAGLTANVDEGTISADTE